MNQDSLNNPKILALDIANLCGWATDNASGVWNLKPQRDESTGMTLLRLLSKVKEVRKLEGITMIVYERVAGRNGSANITNSEKVGMIKTYCESNGILYKAFSAGEIKKHATGKGNAGKPAMIKAAKEKWPKLNIIDDNHADALFILSLAKQQFHI